MYLLLMLLIFMIIIILIMLVLNFFISIYYLNNKREKLISFECGFDMYSILRLPFSIHFYLISILFLIFDVEIILLLPLINSLLMMNLISWFFVSIILIMILYLGLEFEMNSGILKWII